MRSDVSRFYEIGGQTIESNVDLPELRPATAPRRPEWRFEVSAGLSRRPTVRWFHRWLERDGRTWLSFGRDNGDYVLRFSRTATFRVSPSTRVITCEGGRRVPLRTVRHLFLNQVFPLATGDPRRVVLHASAVSLDGGVVGFVGPAGAGKSSLSAALAAGGAALLTDDALIVEDGPDGPVVRSTYGSIRLWPDTVDALYGDVRSHPTVAHYTSKRRVEMGASHVESDGQPLRLLCVLPDRDERRRTARVGVDPMPAREALMHLTRCHFQLDIEASARLAASFHALSDIVSSTPVVTLRYPWNLDRLRQSAREITAVLRRHMC